ncbi:hypothetical protein CNY89_27380, partial [Amaricoccus sp. HAR-UPW-R2A-40]
MPDLTQDPFSPKLSGGTGCGALDALQARDSRNEAGARGVMTAFQYRSTAFISGTFADMVE